MIEAIKLSDKVWYFKNAVEDHKAIFSSLTDWEPVLNQDFMETSIISTKKYLEDSDNAIFKCLDIWYHNNQDFNSENYKLLRNTHFYKRGPGGGYTAHTDFAAVGDGTYEEVFATILTYFSDPEDFGGGEIVFPDYDISLKPEAGSIVIFGNKVRHAVNDVTSGERGLGSVFLVKNSVFYNVLLAISQVFFPLITFPYLARTLGPEHIGALNFAESIAKYFVMLAALGIPIYGIREIAKVQNEIKERTKIFVEIFTINLI